MSVGTSPVTTGQSALPSNQIPVGATYDTVSGNMVLWQADTTSTDSHNNVTAPGLVTEKNSASILTDLAILAGAVSSNKVASKSATGDIVDLATLLSLAGTSGDANTVNSLMGRLTKIRDLLNATLTVSGTVTANAGTGNMGANITQVSGSAIGTSNPLPTNSVAQAGVVAAYGSNPASLTANTDAAFKWGAGGTTPVNHIFAQNNDTNNLHFELDAAANAGSPVLAPGQSIILDVAGTTSIHYYSAGTPNLNGSSANNIVTRAWL